MRRAALEWTVAVGLLVTGSGAMWAQSDAPATALSSSAAAKRGDGSMAWSGAARFRCLV
jgi:hypothetical protein